MKSLGQGGDGPERDLEILLQNPRDPDLPWWRWRGAQDTRCHWSSHLALLAYGRVAIRYFALVDYPLVGVIALVDLKPAAATWAGSSGRLVGTGTRTDTRNLLDIETPVVPTGFEPVSPP
jgi:hypothetical protein